MRELSPENQLILNCATTVMDEESYGSSLDMIRGDINWEYIFNTAKNHNVAPLMYPNLKILNEKQAIPYKSLHTCKINGLHKGKIFINQNPNLL